MLDKFDITLLLNNEFLNNRLSNEFKSFENNIFEILSSRILLDREIKNLIRYKNNSFLFIIKLFIKILYKYNKKHNYNAYNNKFTQ